MFNIGSRAVVLSLVWCVCLCCRVLVAGGPGDVQSASALDIRLGEELVVSHDESGKVNGDGGGACGACLSP